MSSQPSAHIVKCPQCKKATAFSSSNPYRPFCSERCRLIDLGAWATGQYAVAGETASQPPTELTLLSGIDDSEFNQNDENF